MSNLQLTLRDALDYEPRELRFGTSGRRGELIHLSHLEVYINVLAEIEYLRTLPSDKGGIRHSALFYVGHDLRPSSTAIMPEFGGRGEILQAVIRAVTDAGLDAVNLGAIPTPAVMAHAVPMSSGSIMVTGSHIPHDRNGYKTNSSRGELRKEDEAPILQHVAQVRARLYRQPYPQSLFDTHGMFKQMQSDLPQPRVEGLNGYRDRYLRFFPPDGLRGLRILVYQHSAVGRDLLVQTLCALGADAEAIGRSETFVPIDTENIDDALLARLAGLLSDEARSNGGFDAIVSTDGDSDRPLVLGIAGGKQRFFAGDLVGMVAAEYLRADAVVVPITCNDAIERGSLAEHLQPRTKVGSPYVIAGMERAAACGKQAVCGWEANGGFLVGSEIRKDDRVLSALPTRDAFLPILCCLSAMKESGSRLNNLFDALPHRYGRASLLKSVPRDVGQAIVEHFGPAEVDKCGWATGNSLDTCVKRLSLHFSRKLGFGGIDRVNALDGVRIWFDNGDVAHVRPSGNADELRIYAVADTQERADAIARMGVAEPNGILHRLEADVS